MILTARIACLGYLLLLVGITIFSVATAKPASSAYFFGFIIGLILSLFIFGAAALVTLRALSTASPTRLQRASTVNKVYLFVTVAAILAIVAVRTTMPQFNLFIPVCVLVALISTVSIAGLSKAHKQQAVAH